MNRAPKILGTAASAASFIFCSYLLLFNPYNPSGITPDVFSSFSLMFLLPAALALYASLTSRPKLLIVCSIWSMPLGLYLAATPGVFKWLIIGPILILIAGFMMLNIK